MTLVMKYKRILLIDDDEDDQELFQIALGELGIHIECNVMASAREALLHLEKNPAAADLIFLDLNMPLMTGHQFLSEIKKRKELTEIPVVVLSTSSDSGTIHQAINLGAKEFFTKPSDFHELKKILQNILN
jgi:CheY-like chemotaxis protein